MQIPDLAYRASRRRQNTSNPESKTPDAPLDSSGLGIDTAIDAARLSRRTLHPRCLTLPLQDIRFDKPNLFSGHILGE